MAKKIESPADLEKLQAVEIQKLGLRADPTKTKSHDASNQQFWSASAAAASHPVPSKSVPRYAKPLRPTTFRTRRK